MFTKSAEIYDRIYSIKDYGEAARKVAGIVRAERPDARSLLDVGCGTGRHLAYLREDYAVAGIDISDELIAVARRRCPDVPFHVGDMADFDLGERYDAVLCLFSAIGYVRTPERMREALGCMAAHVNPGGLVLVEPWFTPEAFWPDHLTANFLDDDDLKVAWMYVQRREGRLSILDIHYMVGTTEGISTFTERHEIGLFTHEEYEAAFRDAGLEVAHDPQGLFQRGLYVGRRPDR